MDDPRAPRCEQCGSTLVLPASPHDAQALTAQMTPEELLAARAPSPHGALRCSGCGSVLEVPRTTLPFEETDASLGSISPGSSRAGARYRPGDIVGRGGIGEVVAIEDLVLERGIVLKRLLPAHAARASQCARFIAEARVTAQLEHPSIVPVHDLGLDDDGLPFFTMKRVHGRTLASLISHWRVSPAPVVQRLSTFLQVCQAVAFAHSRGVIHRDLKPSNVMVGDFGEVLVMDWGLAKRLEEGEVPAHDPGALAVDDSDDPLRTRDGQVLGTPRYMPPEQAEGRLADIDRRSDVYSLGAVLHELLVFRPAFDVPSLQPLLVAVAAGQRSRPGTQPGDPPVPPELVAIVDKAMARAPADRYASVGALIADVEAFLGGFSVSAHRDDVLVRLLKLVRRHRLVAAAVLALAGGIVATDVSSVVARGQRAAEQWRLAGAALESGDEGGATRALGHLDRLLEVDPGHVAALGWQTRLRGELGTELARRASVAGACPRPTSASNSAERREWFAAQTDVLRLARQLDARGEKDAALARSMAARALASQMSDDGHHAMADLLLDEAREAGLPADVVDGERQRFEMEQARREAEQAEAVRSLLDQARELDLQDPFVYRALRDRLVGTGDPATVRRLIPYVADDRRHVSHLVLDALARAGDTTTTARMQLAQLVDEPTVEATLDTPAVSPWLADCYRRYRPRWTGTASAANLDASRAIALRAMSAHISPHTRSLWGLPELAALGSADVIEVLGAIAWQATPVDEVWQVAHTALVGRSAREVVQAAAASLPAPRRARLLHLCGDGAGARRAYAEARAAGAAEPRALLDLAWMELEHGDPAQAAVLTAQLGDLRGDAAVPLRGEVAVIEGLAARRARRPADALPLLEAAARTLDRPLAYIALGETLCDLGRTDDAIRLARSFAWRRFSYQTAPAYRLLGRALCDAGRFVEADEVLASALHEAPTDERLLALRVEAAAGAERWEFAFDLAEQQYTHDPSPANVARRVAILQRWPRSTRRALIEQSARHPVDVLRRALTPHWRNRLLTRLQPVLLCELLEAAPDPSNDELLLLAELQANVANFAGLERTASMLDQRGARSDAIRWRARARQGRGDLQGALAGLAEAVALAPHRTDWRLAAAHLQVEAGAVDLAAKAFEDGLAAAPPGQLDPAVDAAYVREQLVPLRAFVHALRGEMARSADDWRLAASIGPIGMVSTRYLYAECMARLQASDDAAALAVLDRIIAMCPVAEHWLTHYPVWRALPVEMHEFFPGKLQLLRGELLLRLGKPDQALRDLLWARELVPAELRDAPKLIECLERARAEALR